MDAWTATIDSSPDNVTLFLHVQPLVLALEHHQY